MRLALRLAQQQVAGIGPNAGGDGGADAAPAVVQEPPVEQPPAGGADAAPAVAQEPPSAVQEPPQVLRRLINVILLPRVSWYSIIIASAT